MQFSDDGFCNCRNSVVIKMQEIGMNNQHNNKKERFDGLIVKQMVHFVFFLVVCIWLLYQIHYTVYIREDYGCDDIDNKLRDERIRKVLGRKGGLRSSSYNAEGMELYGIDSIAAAERIKHVAIDNDEGEDSTGDGNVLDWSNFGEFPTKEGEITEKLQEIMVNTSTVDEVKNTSDLDQSLVRVGAVILKKDDKEMGAFRVNDETRVSKHDSAPSRRIDIQVEGIMLSAVNVRKEMEECQKFCLQNISEKQSLNKSTMKEVHEEVKDMEIVEYGKGSMRELL